MTITVVIEENHGPIIYAKSDDAAKRALLETNWVDEFSDVWCPDMSEDALMDAGDFRALKDVYGDNWKEQYLSFDHTKLELMGYHFYTVELYE